VCLDGVYPTGTISTGSTYQLDNQADVDSVWEQEKPEANLPKRSEGVHALLSDASFTFLVFLGTT